MMAVVTTGRRTDPGNVSIARETAQRLAIPFAPRGDASIEEICEAYDADFVLVAKRGLLTLQTRAGELAFHSNMAHLRLKNIRFGDGRDRMAEAMGLARGMDVLDCTLGLGADAIVASFVVGEEGSVTGIESSPLVAAVTGYGLAHFTAENYPMQEAMRRIRVVQVDALDFLRGAADGSYDVVYFDPMFRHPLTESRNLSPLRLVADSRPLSSETVQEALRVARRRVVLKENARSLEFARLGFTMAAGGKYSKVRYGVIEKK